VVAVVVVVVVADLAVRSAGNSGLRFKR
jgi:hypothetical protein